MNHPEAIAPIEPPCNEAVAPTLRRAAGDCRCADSDALRTASAVVQGMQEQMVHLARVATLGTLAASIAHEIRQPLTAIRLEAYAIQHWMKRCPGVADPVTQQVVQEVAEGVHRIQEQSERAEQVIHSLRAMMRSEPNKPQAFTLAQAVRDVLPLLAGRLNDGGIALRIDVDETLPPLHGDSVQIQQVLLNLVLNAIEARKEDCAELPLVELRARRVEPAMLRVEVIDNGGGIAPDQLARIFQPFVSTKSEGMGIGLAICRSIVELHGGSIRAASSEGRTTVTFTLPLQAT